jgi:cyclopropane fatty-acyl-phospholipid synthase-like methyltransferase
LWDKAAVRLIAASLVVLAGCAHHHHDEHRFEHAEEWAKTFDDPARDAEQRPADVVAAMEMTPDMTVADIGAGTGYFEPYLSRAAGHVLALDVEPDMVRYVKERAAREHLANVEAAVIATDDPRLPPVDRVLIVDTWHHIPNRTAYAAKLRAALKPGGRVYIVDFKLEAKHGPPPHHRIPPEECVKELAAAGFTASVIPPALPEQYVVVGR